MRNLLAAVLFAFAACSAHAQLSIEITGAGAQRIPIAIAPLAGEGALLDPSGATIGAIVRADLERSGLFRSLEIPRLVPQPTEASVVNYAEWRARLADGKTVRYRLPEAVERYIRAKGLYGTNKDASATER